MHCDYCDQEATLHLTQVVDGEIRKVHLCEQCAGEMGVDPEAALSVTDLLLNLGKEPMEPKPVRKSEGHRCPGCGLSRSQFKKSGRVGCGGCYSAFHAHVRPMISAMHHHEQHRGRVPVGAADEERAVVRYATAEAALAEAISEEHYEAAAQHRDEMERWSAILAPEEDGGADGSP